MPETVLIVVAHSDDETISMAGTIKSMSLKAIRYMPFL